MQCKEYQQAKERVLFEGCDYDNDCIILPNTFIRVSDGQFLEIGDTRTYAIDSLEELIGEDLTLTPTAITQLGL